MAGMENLISLHMQILIVSVELLSKMHHCVQEDVTLCETGGGIKKHWPSCARVRVCQRTCTTYTYRVPGPQLKNIYFTEQLFEDTYRYIPCI
jgi:hypothetical protein